MLQIVADLLPMERVFTQPTVVLRWPEVTGRPGTASKQGGGKKSFSGAHGKRRTRGSEGMEFETLRRRGVGNGDGVFPSPADYRSLG